jgi:hypothetical protein
MAPAWILLRQAQHQRPDLRPYRRTARPAPGISPFPGDQVAVPAQQRGWGNHERCPPQSGQELGQGREHRTVGWLQIQALDLATQHRDLVTKDQDLDLLRPLATQAQHDQLQHLT